MSRYFVTDAPIAVPEFDDDPNVIADRAPNVIYIKSKMDVETKGRVTSEMFTMGKGGELEARLGANETALLIHNVVRWEGPDFVDGEGKPIPVTAERIRKIDPTEPHWAKVLEVIAERNKAPKSPKASAGTSTSTNAGSTGSATPVRQESVSLQLATGQSRSPLLNAANGHRNRSEG